VGIECHMLVHFSGLEMILYLTKERIYSYISRSFSGLLFFY
jgi:hypothetical protein